MELIMNTTTNKKHLVTKYNFIKYLGGNIKIWSSDTYYHKPLMVRNTVRITTEADSIKLAKLLMMSDIEFEKETGIKRDMIHISNEKKILNYCMEHGTISYLVIWFKYDCEVKKDSPRFYKRASYGVKEYYKCERDVNGIKRYKWNYIMMPDSNIDIYINSLRKAVLNHKRVESRGDDIEREIKWLSVERETEKKRLELSIGISDYRTITLTFEYDRNLDDKELMKALNAFNDYIKDTGYTKLLVMTESDARKLLYKFNYIQSVIFHYSESYGSNEDQFTTTYNTGITMRDFLNSKTGQLDVEKGVADEKLQDLVQKIYNLISIRQE